MGHTLTNLPGEDMGDSDCFFFFVFVFFSPSEAVHKLVVRRTATIHDDLAGRPGVAWPVQLADVP